MGWVEDTLAGLGAPNSPSNNGALQLWAQSEGMPAWENNWLATSLTGPWGGYPVNSAGVLAIPSEPAGVAATVASIDGGIQGSAPIAAALRQDAGWVAIYRAINASGWCSGCSGGQYPIVLYQAIAPSLGQGVGPGPTPGPIGPQGLVPSGGPPQGLPVEQAWNNYRHWADTDFPDYLIGGSWIQAAIDEA